MEKKILRDLYCFLCSLQFEKKLVYDLHVSLIHNYKEKTFVTKIKSEPEETLLVESDISLTNTDVQELNNSSSKQNISFQQESSKSCNICDAVFDCKSKLDRHVLAIHEGKEPFKCNSCEAKFILKIKLNRHIASIH